jgi:hypothetical protein
MPLKFLPYRQAPWKEKEIMKHIQLMKENGIIEAANSPWAAPVVLARKKDGTWRFCVDYRALNLSTKKDSYPLPRIDDTLDSLGSETTEYYTIMDLASRYWHILIHQAN